MWEILAWIGAGIAALLVVTKWDKVPDSVKDKVFEAIAECFVTYFVSKFNSWHQTGTVKND